MRMARCAGAGGHQRHREAATTIAVDGTLGRPPAQPRLRDATRPAPCPPHARWTPACVQIAIEQRLVVGPSLAPWQFVIMTTPRRRATPGGRVSRGHRASNGASWSKTCSRVRRSTRRLVAKTYDGLADRTALRAKGARPTDCRPRTGTPWSIIQRVDHPDPAAANAEALHDLENGATGLCAGLRRRDRRVRLRSRRDRGRRSRVRSTASTSMPASRSTSISVRHVQDAATRLAALVEAPRHCARRHQSGSASTRSAPRRSAAAAAAVERARADLQCRHFRSWRAGLSRARSQRLTAGRSTMPAARRRRNWLTCWRSPLPICARSRPAGLRSMPRARMIYFRLAADADQFLTIAKFRALRTLWARVEEACGLAPVPPLRHGRDRLADDDASATPT